MAPSRYDWKIVDWDVKPQHNQPTFLRTAKTLIRLGSEDSDQTGWMPRLIWVFAERKSHFVGFVVWRLNYIYATSWENLFLPYANNKGAVWSAPLLFPA